MPDESVLGRTMSDPFGDPATGEAVITLSDGVARKLRFDHRAFLVLEETTKLPFVRAAQLTISATTIRTLLFAGMYSDAKARGEADWSLDKVDGLIDLVQYGEINLKVAWALGKAMQRLEAGMAGELKASARKATRGRGRGRRR